MNREELPVTSPCDADWATMTLSERGRFCAECRKVVHDLEQLSERDARALLESPRTDGLCVRYVHDATGEIVFRREALRRRVGVAAVAVAAVSLSLTACMGAVRPRPPVTNQR
jgi:hypothetical protein